PTVCAVPSCHKLSLFTLRRPSRSTLFAYTTLFRSRVSPKSLWVSRKITGRLRSTSATRSRSTADSAPNEDTSAILPGNSRVMKRSEEHTSELQSRENLVCRLLLEKKNR